MRRPASTMMAFSLALLVSAAARAEDTDPPVITHTPLEKADKGKPVKITAQITDASKFFPQVFYKWNGARSFEKPIDMKKARKSKDTFEATMPNKGDTLEYYIEAYDEFGNGPARSGTPESPNKVDASGAEAPAVVENKRETPAATEPGKPAETPAAEPEKPKEEPKDVAVEKPRPGPKTAAGGGARTWTWIVGGTGLGLLAGGVMTGLAFKSADDAYKARAAEPQNNPASLQQQYDANASLGTKATIMLVGGTLLVAGGAVLYFLEPGMTGNKHADATDPEKDKRLRFAATPLQGGGAAVVAGRF